MALPPKKIKTLLVYWIKVMTNENEDNPTLTWINIDLIEHRLKIND